jgi:hypothetical protein
MEKSLSKIEYDRFVSTLRGPLKSLNGEIYYVSADNHFNTNFGCYLNIVIRESQAQPDLIFKLMTEIAEKFKTLYDEYPSSSDQVGKTAVRIKDFLFTGGLDGYLGFNLNDSMHTVLPVETLQWTKELRQVKTLMTFLKDPVGFRSVMEIDDTTMERLNRSLKQLQSQKNIPHNLQVHLDFVEEGTFTIPDEINTSMGDDGELKQIKVYYKFPQNIKLKFKCDARSHNKITGEVDFDFMPIYVEYPKLSEDYESPKRELLKTLISERIKHILKSNDLVPVRFSSNLDSDSKFNFSFKWI